MNKSLQLAYRLLVTIVVLSLLAVIQSGTKLWQANKINHFINHVGDYDEPLNHSNALFAQAFYDVKNGQPQQALDLLTQIVTSDDLALKAAAYYNRGNIHLRQAQSMDAEDRKRLPSVELAKQDYRTALLLSPELWDARFNLELALRMVPEKADVSALFDKPIVNQQKTVQSYGFRVDLP
jgi:mxaK protein